MSVAYYGNWTKLLGLTIRKGDTIWSGAFLYSEHTVDIGRPGHTVRYCQLQTMEIGQNILDIRVRERDTI